MLFKTLALVMGLAVLPVFAAGGESGGGGDSLEERVNEIRSDILAWINAGGSKSLVLPSDVTHEAYVSLMTDILQPKKVVLGFEESEINVGGVPKTCRGYIAKENQRPHILCNIARFKATGEAEQYRLIHHEYAGLVRIEKNDEGASDYAISSQLTDYLRKKTVLRLSIVKKESNGSSGFDPLRKLEEARVLYAATLEHSAYTRAKTEKFKVDGRILVEKLKNKDSGPELNEIFVSCSEDLEKKYSESIRGLEANLIIRDGNLLKTLQSIESSVAGYIEAEECVQCNEYIRSETMKMFKTSVVTEMQDLKDGEYHGSTAEDQFKDLLRSGCDFSKYFQSEMDKQTFDNKNSIHNDYSESLRVEYILSGEYDKALSYIVKNAPIKVERKSQKIGKASSKFDGKKVKMVMVYDWSLLTGYDNVRFPKVENPIHLIKGYLNEN